MHRFRSKASQGQGERRGNPTSRLTGTKGGDDHSHHLVIDDHAPSRQFLITLLCYK